MRAWIDRVDSAYLPFGMDTRPPKPPRAFVNSVWISVAGIVFMLAVETTEVFTLYDAKMPSLRWSCHATRKERSARHHKNNLAHG